MKIKKSLFFLITILLSISYSCEKDDVCLGPTTPKMIIRFYDYSQTSDIKPTADLTVIALPVQDTIYKQEATDSIALPLDINNNSTKYIFIENNNPDTLQISYDLHPFFVSKACGYIMFFDDIAIELKPDGNQWIKQIGIIQNQIQIDTSAHVKIYH